MYEETRCRTPPAGNAGKAGRKADRAHGAADYGVHAAVQPVQSGGHLLCQPDQHQRQRGRRCGISITGSYAARCLGAGQKEEADRTVSTAFFLSIFVGSAIGIVILLNISQILSVLGATQTILPYASGYAFWVIMATPFYSATFVLTTVLRQEGSPELAMFGSVVSMARPWRPA